MEITNEEVIEWCANTIIRMAHAKGKTTQQFIGEVQEKINILLGTKNDPMPELPELKIHSICMEIEK